MKKFTFLLLLPLLLMACTKETPPDSTEVPSSSEQNDTIQSENTTNMKDYFLQDGSIAHFLGDGNEYATYTLRTEWLDDHHVNVYEDNGGMEMLRSYRLGDNQITLLQQEPSDAEGVATTLETIRDMQPIGTYLQFPLEKGDTFDKWTVTATDAELDTPLQSFQDVVIIEHTYEDGAVSRVYFAEGFGEIKREYSHKTDDNEFKVTSVIESIE
ncbi:hypothetical protein [Sporosarcina cyprini]|uniref:hypothetical protein n=1 Tax=Sporosarcina cyprini TaxID=2910523 RepID=UPI001EDDC63B|nr:hypothetical protein [Sporosarcina cyprini]MCG3087977.1 hypothetical protein [Sporosarcina cyprini]